MFGIGGIELFLILIFGFLIFGPDKLPAIAKTVAQGLTKFRNAQEEMTKVIKTEVYDPNSDEPFKNPLEILSKVGDAASQDEKKESFSERKARYDKERAAKKAEEQEGAVGPAESAGAVAAEASAALRVGDAAAKSDSEAGAPNVGEKASEEKTPATPGSSEKTGDQEAPAAPSASVSAEEPAKPITDASDKPRTATVRKSAEELYGTKPKAQTANADKPAQGAAQSDVPAKTDAADKGVEPTETNPSPDAHDRGEG